MDNSQTRPWPSDAEFDQMIAGVQLKIQQTLRSETSPWWKKWSRLTTAAFIVVCAGGVAGGAYAANQLLTSTPPSVFTGNTVVKLDAPAPGDKWLNVQVAYTCRPGERFTLKNGEQTIFDEDCDANHYSTDESIVVEPSRSGGVPPDRPARQGRAQRGMFKGLPIDDVQGNSLMMTSTLTRDYRIVATFGPTVAMKHLVLPGRRADGAVDWATPDYTVNEYGLTVGAPKINTPEDQWPDLYPMTFRGREAYFLGEDMRSQIPMDPSEAKAYKQERRREGLTDDKGNVYAKVYAADGKTVLGKKLVGRTSSG